MRTLSKAEASSHTVIPGYTDAYEQEFVAFTPMDEARQEAAVMMPNVMKYAKEHGIELPSQMAGTEQTR